MPTRIPSSLDFPSYKVHYSGRPESKHTILAARLVVPPDLIAPAFLSRTLK